MPYSNVVVIKTADMNWCWRTVEIWED